MKFIFFKYEGYGLISKENITSCYSNSIIPLFREIVGKCSQPYLQISFSLQLLLHLIETLSTTKPMLIKMGIIVEKRKKKLLSTSKKWFKFLIMKFIE